MVPRRAASLAPLVLVLALGLLVELSQQKGVKQQRMDNGNDDFDDCPAYENPVRPAEKDLVEDLPGLNKFINFDHYSGYLRADNETKPSKFLHYWFVESQSNSPADDPVLVWLNGGPGCSSLVGLFAEIGPFKVNEDGVTLALNPYSWNQHANIIFLESPSNVGFSYSLSSDGVYDDDTTALENYLALKSFMEKFPRFANNPLYLAGESYAGVYLPTLGVLVDADPELNLEGVAIGNGCLDDAKQKESLVFFNYYHGLVGETVWNQISQHCCDGRPPARESCTLSGPKLSENCRLTVNEVFAVLDSLNPYNIYNQCPPDERDHKQSTTRLSNRENALHNVTAAVQAKAACFDRDILTRYLNQPAVREAIHIPKMVDAWLICHSKPYNYEEKYALQPGGVAPQIHQLIGSERKLRLLVYNGDVDTVCNFLGAEWFMDDLGRTVISDYGPWFLGDLVAGFVKRYDGITFATVLGAGHSVPADRPQVAFELSRLFLDQTSNKKQWP